MVRLISRSRRAFTPPKRAGRILIVTEMTLLCGAMCMIFVLVGPLQTSNRNVPTLDDQITHVALNRSGRSLFVRKALSEIGTLELVSGTYQALGRYDRQCIVSVCGAAHHHRLLALIDGSGVELFEDRQLLARFDTNVSAVSALTFAPDGEAYFVLDETQVVRIALDVEEVFVKEFHLAETVVEACVTNDFFVAISGAAVDVYHRRDGKRAGRFPIAAGFLGTPICSEDGKHLLISYGSAIRCYDISTGCLQWTLTEPTNGTFICLATVPSNPDLLATSGFDGIRLIDVASGHCMNRIGIGMVSPSIAVSPEGDRIYAGGVDGKVTVWSVNTGTQMNQIAVTQTQ